jgi:hypothetical protein
MRRMRVTKADFVAAVFVAIRKGASQVPYERRSESLG